MEKRPSVQIGCFNLVMESYSFTHLEEALKMIFDGTSGVEYSMSDEKSITLFSYAPSSIKYKLDKLPFKMNFEGTLGLLKAWYAQAKWGSQPDHDGSNSKGFRLESGIIRDGWADGAKVLTLSTHWIEFHK